MKKSMKMFFGVFLFGMLLIPFTSVSAATEVNSYEDLTAALATDETVIEIGSDFDITAPIEIKKDLTINGHGNTLTATYPKSGGNDTILSSSTSGVLVLNDLVLSDSPKYGVQAHNGGTVVLNGVTIRNSGFGAALANGGTLVIQDLLLDNNAYGIELGIGDEVTGIPTIIMDGTLSIVNQDGKTPIHVDTTQITADKTITVENTIDTVQTIDLEGNILVIKDANGDIVYTSDELLEGTEVTVNTEEPLEPTTPTEEPEVTEPTEDVTENPETSDSTLLILGVCGLSAAAMFTLKRKLS